MNRPVIFVNKLQLIILVLWRGSAQGRLSGAVQAER